MNCKILALTLVVLAAVVVVESSKTIECKAGDVGTCIKCPTKDGKLEECAKACKSFDLVMTTCKLDKPAAGQKAEDVKAHCDCGEKIDFDKLEKDKKNKKKP